MTAVYAFNHINYSGLNEARDVGVILSTVLLQHAIQNDVTIFVCCLY